MSVKRARPIADVTADYDCDASEYPEQLRVLMDDGTMKRYALVIDQPHPAFLAAMSILKDMPEGAYQYVETIDVTKKCRWL